MIESTTPLKLDLDLGPGDDNRIQPFSLEASALRGRAVKLGSVLDEILTLHQYPDTVAQLLGEGIVLGCLLSSALKYDGIFTLQTKGDGPIPLLVADMTHDGGIRGYARLGQDADVPQLRSDGRLPLLERLTGQGYLAFTVDQAHQADRYQGIVELQGASLTDTVRHYFKQSEQVETGLVTAVGRVDGRWRAGGLMVQQLPDQVVTKDRDDRLEDWRRAMVLLQSATGPEMLDRRLPQNDLLYRLFHEDGVRVYDPMALRRQCRCNRPKIESVLVQLDPADLDELKIEGAVVVTCEFCNSVYRFTEGDLDTLFRRH